MLTAHSGWVPVHACVQLAEAQEMALVLVALDLDYWLVHQESGGDFQYLLLVPVRTAELARRHLGEYLREQCEWPPAERSVARMHLHLRDVLGLWVILPAVFLCQQYQALGVDWLSAGSARAGLICQGEWWRTLTALTLHAHGPHLVGNLVFGTLFALLLSHELGRGLTWFSVVLAGAVGNGLNACIQAPEHTSIGASTAVFAAIGITMMVQWRHHTGHSQLLRRIAPVVIGVAFLGFLGTAGEHTDVLAHVTGLSAGMLCGVLLNRVRSHLPAPGAPQGWLEVLTLLLLGSAWLLALQHVAPGAAQVTGGFVLTSARSAAGSL